MRRVILTSCVLLIGAVGCDPPSKPITEPTATKSTSVDKVTWPTTKIDTAALSALDQPSRAAIAQSPIPVLVPNRKALLEDGKVMVDVHWYAFSSSSEGVTVSIHATDVVHTYPDVAPVKGKHRVRGFEGWVTQNEAIWSASWREHGVAYSLDVECAEPTEPRCKDDAFVQALANDLVYVGGKGAR